MNNQVRFKGRVAVLLGILLAAVLSQGCMDQANGSIPEAEEEVAAIPVEVVTVSSDDVSAFYSGTTTIEADEQAVVVSQITGVVLTINAEEGDYVEAGKVLAKVETDRYALEVERSNAALKRLETDYQRKKELFEKKLVSADDFERVSAEYEAQKAAVGLARLELKYTNIQAPISGYVSERMVRAGNLVELHQPVYRITSYDPLLAVLHVPERELSVLHKGQPVSVKLDALPTTVFTGEVIRISPVVDPGTGTFRVTAEVNDPEGMLKPGLFGRVDILYDRRENVPVIPRTAVVTEDEASHVFVIGEDSNVTRRSVRLGYERNGLVEVIEGVSPGERVVTAGKGSLSDGSRVEVVGVPTSPAAPTAS
ncbi:MAG TPA: efflux RND transporter periplasmic adaptor subunit [Xanthomonadales bacterium]|nr:efflux RND transporter periplasmic adaptor subunit [Xanthomonadales bacterium]